MIQLKDKNMRRKITEKVFSFSLILLTLITALVMSGCSKEEEPVVKVIRPAKIMTIEQSTKAEMFKFPGKVQALDRVELSFEVSGKLIELAVNEGQRVKKGDLIARIDPSDYQSKLEAQQAKVNQAKAELDRYTNLLKERVVAKSTFDVKKRNYEVALSEMQIARKAYNDTML
jgi:RND family efflux transporter MFP subunit